MRFEELGIIEPILKALADKNYIEPTAIQEKAIPLVLKNNDVLGCAQTGTGKTAAFAIPIIQFIQNKSQHANTKKVAIEALVITPTRELAIQISENVRDYSKYTNLRHAVIFGGVKQHAQVQELQKGVNILIATPGRLLDLINQGYVSLNSIKIFVLDEADRMLDMGFINDIKKVIRMLPQKRQSLFFSATMPENIVQLSRTILNNPQKIKVNPVSSTAETIQQYIYFTNKSDKKKLLLHVLKDSKIEQVLLFSRTKRGADRITRDLKKKNINAAAIHGDKAQNQRQRALQDFKAGKVRVLVATDIAARGIDIDKLKYVINFDIPEEPETYVHRIGRSGRAGEEGTAISLCEPEENERIRDIEKLINKTLIVIKDNPFPQTDKPMSAEQKKELNKAKQLNRQKFSAKHRKKKGGGGGRNRPNKSNSSGR